MTVNETGSQQVIDKLASAIGVSYVLSGDADREFYSMDVYGSRQLPIAVVQPGTIADLQALVRIAAETDIAMVARGGGASYTDGYSCEHADSILIDTSRLNNIVEINEEDMFVTVQPGVTWAKLDETLAAKGLRTPFWGPFSGLLATVGGSASQNAVSLGSGTFGSCADSILAMEVVIANGETIRTGALATENTTPFFRYWGPDFTGLFCGDAGVLGIKSQITLRLIKRPTNRATCSFGFNDFAGLANGMAAAAREGVVDTNFGLDPKLQQGQLGGTDAAAMKQAAVAVFKASRNIFDGLFQLMKMGIAGKSFLADYDYSAHFSIDGYSQAEVAHKLVQVRKAIAEHGTEIANTMPTVLMAMPFIPLYPILGPQGQRWVPMHGIMPFSKLIAFNKKLDELYDSYAERMDAAKVEKAAMYTTISTSGFLFEPVFYWQDDRTVFHKRYLPQEYLDVLPEYDANPEGRALVAEMKDAIQDVFTEFGAVHMQLGKAYTYMRGREAQSSALIRDIKAKVDPKGLMNPGGLRGLTE
ncbi:MAG: FAD-binding oxidoreductase [Gammaproteobacteria bacterium]|nr:FAD-binding oxidoreductase [Gammaproteobacteria bacterium]